MRSLLLWLACGAVSAAPALMPWPAHIDLQEGSLDVADGIAISTSGCRDSRVEAAGKRAEVAQSRTKATLRVECGSAGAKYPSLKDDESYTLDISPSGARLSSP